MYKPELETFLDKPELSFEATCCECADSVTITKTVYDWEFSIGFETYDKLLELKNWSLAKNCGRDTTRADLWLCPNCAKK